MCSLISAPPTVMCNNLFRGVDHKTRQFCKLFYFLTSQVLIYDAYWWWWNLATKSFAKEVAKRTFVLSGSKGRKKKGANIYTNYCKEFTSLFVVCYRNARPFPKLHTTHLDGHFAINPVLCTRIILSLEIEMQNISNTHITVW